MPSAWTACSPTSARSVANRAGASPLLVGTGKDQVHLLIVMTAERGLCGGFNSNIARARARRCRAAARGRQDGQDPVRRPQGLRTPCAATGAGNIVDRVDLKGVKQLNFANAAGHRRQGAAHCSKPASSTSATLYFSEFKSVIAQKPTALQLIPAHSYPAGKDADGAAKSQAVYEYEPSEEEILGYLLIRATSRRRSSAACWRTPPPSRARACRAMDSATRNAGDMINKLTIRYNRQRQANITKELIEIISGAEAL